MSPRAHTALRLAAIAWIAMVAWVPRGFALATREPNASTRTAELPRGILPHVATNSREGIGSRPATGMPHSADAALARR